jgi:hypothetical protein
MIDSAGAGAVGVLRSGDRPVTTGDGITSRHSLSFGRHYDPANTHHGSLLAHNDELVEPGSGFGRHRHRDLEIVTWVLDGVLTHEDSAGRLTTLPAGAVQCLSAGSGIEHAERNDGHEPLRFVQLWLRPDPGDRPPSYQHLLVPKSRLCGRLTTVAAGTDDSDGQPAVPIGAAGVTVRVARLHPGETAELPASTHRHVFAAVGEVELASGTRLRPGDAVRQTGVAGDRMTALSSTEVLVVAMNPPLAG